MQITEEVLGKKQLLTTAEYDIMSLYDSDKNKATCRKRKIDADHEEERLKKTIKSLIN